MLRRGRRIETHFNCVVVGPSHDLFPFDTLAPPLYPVPERLEPGRGGPGGDIGFCGEDGLRGGRVGRKIDGARCRMACR